MDYLLIWDVDGTLIKMKGIGKKSLDKAFYELYSIENAFSNIDMAGRLDKVILEEAFRVHNLDKGSLAKFREKYAEVLEVEVKKIKTSIACPGIIELLEALSEKENIYNVIGTGNMEKGARSKLSIDNLNRFFPLGAFSEEETERWQLIEKAISNAKDYFGIDFKNENIYVIGDTPRDIECGKKLKVKTIGVATGSYTCDDLLACGADYVFETFENKESFLKIFS